jgi:hypothetical protein
MKFLKQLLLSVFLITIYIYNKTNDDDNDDEIEEDQEIYNFQ